MSHRQYAVGIGVGLLLLCLSRGAIAEAPNAETILLSGELTQGKAEFEAYAQANPLSDNDRFGLGIVQLAGAFETLSQSLYDFGLRDYRGQYPQTRMLVVENPHPKAIRYQDLRALITRFLEDVERAERTLAQVEDKDVKLPLALFQIRLDFNGDHDVREIETLGRLVVDLRKTQSTLGAPSVGRMEEIVVALDYADCLWLRSYCHYLAAAAETWLAYDMQELHDRVGFLIFQKIDSPHAYLADAKALFAMRGVDVVDVIALIHLVNFPVKEAKRMEAAYDHFQQMVALNRRCWDAVEAEPDNDREFIAGPGQDSVVVRGKTTPKMLAAWREFLDEYEEVIQGEKLIPHPRIVDGRGMSLKKFYVEPQPIDVILWIQGSGITSFLEKGPLVDDAFWGRVNRANNAYFFNLTDWYE